MSRVLNFIWINLDFPHPSAEEDTPFKRPMPDDYLAGVQKAGSENPDTDVVLWVDKKRLTGAQTAHLEQVLSSGASNVRLKDLRDIKAYDREALYNKSEKSPKWRDDKQSLIWRQVDAAKVLVCLQGNYDQVFFADMDLANVKTGNPKLQKMIDAHGIFVNHSPDHDLIENQMWGFDRARRLNFFEDLYKKTLKEAYKGENGWMSLIEMVNVKLCASKLTGGEGIDIDDITHLSRESGIRAHHPDHRLTYGLGGINANFEDKNALSKQFAKVCGKVPGVLRACLPRKLAAMFGISRN